MAGSSWQEGQGPAAAGRATCRDRSSFPVSRARTVLRRAQVFPLPSPSQQPGDWQDDPRQELAGSHNAAIASLLPQMPASVLLRPLCHALQDSPQAGTSPGEGPARMWGHSCCARYPSHRGIPAQAPSPAPTHGAWHARRSRAGQRAPPDLRGAGQTATYPLCWGVEVGARGAYVTGFVTSPGRGFGGEPAPKGRAVLLRAVLGAKLYFRGSEQGSES